jgi:hypothetical protein
MLEHARRRPAEERALLTANHKDFNAPDARTALRSAGIAKYFTEVDNLLGWLGSLT